MKTDKDSFGKELILDLVDCDTQFFTERYVKNWFSHVCNRTNMVPIEQHFWEEWDHEEPHLNGITAVQFISTSSITIHATEHRKGARINIFTCKDFDADDIVEFTQEWFGGRVVQQIVLIRQ